MSRFTDRLEAAGIPELVSSASAAVDAFNDGQKEAAETAVPGGISRLLEALDLVLVVTVGAPPTLVTDSDIANVSNSLNNIQTELRNFVADGDPGHLTNALESQTDASIEP